MRVKATVMFTAASEVEFEVPDSTPPDEASIQRAIEDSVRSHGVPEVIKNPTIEFMFASTCQPDGWGHDFELPDMG